MDFKRLLIAALSFSMIRVVLPGSDVVCTKHVGHEIRAAHECDQKGHDQRPCEMPNRADCCAALASCGNSVAVGDDQHALPPLTSSEAHVPARSEKLTSRSTSPDPPPPKA